MRHETWDDLVRIANHNLSLWHLSIETGAKSPIGSIFKNERVWGAPRDR